ncbi:MAG: hypothetical protein GYA15_00250 [Leptolinea sp.]|nr:hypothetical protein [Leptolinea sp.]
MHTFEGVCHSGYTGTGSSAEDAESRETDAILPTTCWMAVLICEVIVDAVEMARLCSCAPLATPSIALDICSVDDAVFVTAVAWSAVPLATCWMVLLIWLVAWPA